MRRSKSIVDGNSKDLIESEKELERVKKIQYDESLVALKRWQSVLSKLFEDILDEILKENYEALAKRLHCIKEDVKELSQDIESMNIRVEKPIEYHASTLRFMSEIEKKFSNCNAQEEKVLSLNLAIGQQKGKEFLKVFKDLFLAKFASLIDKDIEDSSRKHGKDQVKKRGMLKFSINIPWCIEIIFYVVFCLKFSHVVNFS